MSDVQFHDTQNAKQRFITSSHSSHLVTLFRTATAKWSSLVKHLGGGGSYKGQYIAKRQ
jgi:hypothetical protein